MTNAALSALPFVDYQYPLRPAPPGQRLVLVGEAPGADEVRLGSPFVGRSGRLLDEALTTIGVERATLLVANVFRRQPPGNKVGHFFASRRKARTEGGALAEAWGPFGTSDYCRAEFAGELDYLRQVLSDWRPAVIVALGRTPLWALTGLGGIASLRGQILPGRLVAGVPVLPTYHPSFLLRGQWSLVPVFQADLRQAAILATAASPVAD